MPISEGGARFLQAEMPPLDTRSPCSASRIVAARTLLLLLSLALSGLLAEGLLRFWYRDGGTLTLGAPGGALFEHLTKSGGMRGRLDHGPRRPSVPRLMIVGDSVTYGLGVRDWRQTWPEVLATSYEQSGRPVELAVFATPGRGPWEHVDELNRWGAGVAPDVFIYQWYVNDLEVDSLRQNSTLPWHEWRGHAWLAKHSHVYYLVDHLFSGRVHARQYVDDITHTFVPGSREWMAFERSFHELSTIASNLARHRVLMLYPQVPFTGRYPLEVIHDRMRSLAGSHTLSIAPIGWVRSAGQLAPDGAAPWRQVVTLPKGTAGLAVNTPPYAAIPGAVDVAITFKVDERTTGTVGAIEVVDADSGELLATHALSAASAGFEKAIVHAVLAGTSPRHVCYRVRSTGLAPWRVAAIDLDVNYGYEVVDLTRALNRFDTHVSLFDSHPNAEAHRVMAAAIRSTLDRRQALGRSSSHRLPPEPAGSAP